MVKPNRVIHIMSGFNGGISAFIMNKAKELDGELVFDVICLEKPTYEFSSIIHSKGGKILQVCNPKVSGWINFYNQLNMILKVYPKNTLIHSHLNGLRCLPFYLVSKQLKMTRFAIHAHTSEPFTSNKLVHRSKQYLNRLMADDKISCGKKATENIFNVKPEKNEVIHIPNSIDESQYFKIRDIDKLKNSILGIKDNRLVLGNIGRLKYLKNQSFIIKILAELKENDIDFICYFAGSGPLEDDLKKLVFNYKLENNVVFLGFRNDIPDLLAITDIFLLPSLSEGLPTVVVEAQASNTYSLISDRITDECDLGLDLVDFITIDDVEKWVNSILSFQKDKKNQLTEGFILESLEKQKFTNERSFNLYKKYVFRQIEYYNIEGCRS